MVVYATAYDLSGTTATGLPVGIGVVATDPTVIPLGTRFWVPGYGAAVAADTGGAIKGARIDVWLPPDRIGSWTTRYVTITFL
jgi:3D (Asp-Asp-Asp) domain-containing protein